MKLVNFMVESNVWNSFIGLVGHGNASQVLRSMVGSYVTNDAGTMNEDLAAELALKQKALNEATVELNLIKTRISQNEAIKEAQRKDKETKEDAADRCKVCECKLNGNGYQGYCFTCFDPKHLATVEAEK